MPGKLSPEVQRLMRPPAPLVATIADDYERPVAELIRPHDEIDGEPLGSILGIPFDSSILGRQGAKLGPAAVRAGFNACLCYEPGLGVDLAGAPRVADYGDVDVVQTNVDETWDRVSLVVQELIGFGRPLAVIGGDHGLSYPIIRGVTRAVQGRLGVISIDAHFDVRVSHHGEKGSGVPFRYMLEELADSVSGANFTEFGIGGWLNTKLYHDYLREQGAHVTTAREIWKGDLLALFQDALDRAADGTDAIYLTFDIDAIEGATVGGTNVPAIGGLSPMEALEIVWRFGLHPKALAMDVMEVSPVWDHSGLS
ncbi:MAG TPA: agmatinase family protein, partial [Solirubrobacteraceae bacterium]